MKTISFIELEEWQNSERCYALIDVLPDHEKPEIPLPETRSRDFVEKINNLGVSKSQAIVLYETGTASIEAATAAAALMHEGYDEVYYFSGPRAPMYAAQHSPSKSIQRK